MGKNSDLSVYAIDKSLGEASSLGIRTEIFSKNIKTEINENKKKVMTQAKIQESIQLAEREQIKQKH